MRFVRLFVRPEAIMQDYCLVKACCTRYNAQGDSEERGTASIMYFPRYTTSTKEDMWKLPPPLFPSPLGQMHNLFLLLRSVE